MQAGENLLREHVDPVDDRCGAWIGGPRLTLLLVGHGERPQSEDLVDLGGVEQLTWALRADLRVVVHEDRRGQHHVPVVRVPGQHRDVCTLRQSFAATAAQAGGSSRERKDPPRTPSREWVATSDVRRASVRGAPE